MNENKWQNIKDLFSEALEKPPAERESFLEDECPDAEMRAEVRQLLISFNEDDEFLENAAVGEVAEEIVAEETADLFDETVGRYNVKSLLGEGGMGKVYLAKDTQLERLAAVKILSPYLSDDEHRVKRFFQEAKSASALNHPNILTIYEIGEFKDTFFIAAEYVKGETLRQRLKRKRLSIAEITKISIQIVSALAAAHEANIIHRDVKPENVMIRRDGLVKILDFGLAKLVAERRDETEISAAQINLVNTAPRVVLGTVAYMSPEQARGKKTDYRTDIWSFGVCLYELLAGFPPFKGETSSDQIAEILTAEPKTLPPDVPFELKQIVGKTLRKNVEERYQTAAELLADLSAFEKTVKEDVSREKITSYTEVQKTSGNRFRTVFSQITAPIFSRKFASLALAAVLAVAVAAGVFGVYSYRQNSVYAPQAEAVRWYRDATEATREGNYFKAKKMLEQAVALDEKYLPAQAKLAEIWFQLDYEDKAAQTMLKVTESIPRLKGLSENEEIYLQAVNATVRRDFKNALALYEKIYENAPADEKIYALFDVGRAAEKAEDFKRAEEIYGEIVRLDPQFAAAHVRLGYQQWFNEQRDEANESFEKAETIYSAQSNYDGLGELYYLKGSLHLFYEELTDARKNLEKSLEIARATNNSALIVKTTLDLGGVDFGLGDNVKARALIDEGLKLAQIEQLEYFTANALLDLGIVYRLKSELDEAEKYVNQALQIARVNGGRQTEARAMITLGDIALAKFKPREAILYIEPALKFYRENNFKPEAALCFFALALSQNQTGKYQEAIEILTGLVRDAQETDNSSLLANAEAVLGDSYLQLGKYKDALAQFEKSYEINKSLGKGQEAAKVLHSKAQVLTELGRLSEAAQTLKLSENSLADNQDKQLEYLILLQKGQIALYQNNFTEAVKQTRLGLEKAGKEIGLIMFQGNLQIALAELRGGNLQKAEEYFSQAEEFVKNPDNPQTAADFQLAKAEFSLKKNLPLEALEQSLQAKEIYLSLDAKQSAWRALSIAAKAAAMLNKTDESAAYKSQASEIFNSFERLWGKENFQKFRLRKDVETFISQTTRIEG